MTIAAFFALGLLAGAAVATILLFAAFLRFWLRELQDRRAEETALNARAELLEVKLGAAQDEYMRRLRMIYAGISRATQEAEMDTRATCSVIAHCRGSEGKALLN